MIETVDNVIAAHDLKPHPFEGWSKELSRIPGTERHFLWLITAEMFIPWHRMPAECKWLVREGSNCAVSVSTDGEHASASVIGEGYLPSLTLPAAAFQTLTAVGRWTLLEGILRPDIALTDREDQPDHWYPNAGIGLER